MVKYATLLPVLVKPEPRCLKDEEAGLPDQAVIAHETFNIGKAVGNKQGRHVLGRTGYNSKPLEYVDAITVAVATIDNGLCRIGGLEPQSHIFW
jgi:hypothetical protein